MTTLSKASASIGSNVAFSSVLPATIDEAGFADASLSWVESDEEVTLGDVGDEVEVLTGNNLKTGRKVKRMGTSDAGQMSAEFFFDYNNPAQVLLKQHIKSKEAIAVREELSAGVYYYFVAYVSSTKTAVGGSGDLTMFKCNLELDSEIVEVAV